MNERIDKLEEVIEEIIQVIGSMPDVGQYRMGLLLELWNDYVGIKTHSLKKTKKKLQP